MSCGDLVILSVDQMYRADALAMAGGIPGHVLMENAGRLTADAICRRWPPRRTAVLCGPGNNGGDGFVIARHLAARGWPVSVALLGSLDRLKGDACAAAEAWEGPVAPLEPGVLNGSDLIVDAIFGAGLARPVEGVAAATLVAAAERRVPVVAVDVPSGVQGDTGAVLGVAIRADLTVTFFRRKPGHLLFPGRGLCGTVETVDIGIPQDALDGIAAAQWANGPGLWADAFAWPSHASHKYTRGHVLIVGGALRTGAARLAARAAMRAGAGLVSIAAPPEAVPIYAVAMPGALIEPLHDAGAFRELLQDPRRNVVLIGPGGGLADATRDRVLEALSAGRPLVLDADAITVFQEAPDSLFRAVGDTPCILTPHDGEFARLFPDIGGDRLSRARAAAERSGTTMVLKGADTVIAASDGRAAINANAPPDLATGGTGDVLAGFIAALLGQGMPPFEAACAAVWLHGEAAATFGPGLIAEDLSEQLPAVLKLLKRNYNIPVTQV